MTYKNLWDIPNLQLEKTQQLNENLRMKRNDLRIHLNNLEKEQQTELKESAREENLEVRAEVHEILKRCKLRKEKVKSYQKLTQNELKTYT